MNAMRLDCPVCKATDTVLLRFGRWGRILSADADCGCDLSLAWPVMRDEQGERPQREYAGGLFGSM